MDARYADVQRLMSPSQWVRRITPEDAVPTHLKVTALASRKAREAVPHRLDIRYGPKPRQLLDEFGCDLPADAPIAVYIHGGYWQGLSKEDCAYIVEPLYAAGCRVFILGYDLCPDVKFGDIVEEIGEATKFIVRFAAGHGVSRVWFLGHSAGGHLVAWIATQGTLGKAASETRPLKPIHFGIVPLAGLFDLRPLLLTDYNDALQLSKEEAEKWSPLLQPISLHGLSDGTFPLTVVTVTCQEDSPEFQRQSALMHEKLKLCVPDAHFISKNNVDHFGLVENLSHRDDQLTRKMVCLISGKN